MRAKKITQNFKPAKREILRRKISWIDPLIFAQKIAANYSQESWAFLYSGLHQEIKKSRSYIALFPRKKILCEKFFEAEKILKNSDEKWFGYLSYEVAKDFEKLPKTKKSAINLPKICLINFAVIFEFDHDKKILRATCDDKKQLDEIFSWKKITRTLPYSLKVSNDQIASNFSNQSYLAAIEEIKKMIARGDFYQTNLTRKFYGKIEKKIDQKKSFELFAKLTKISPANYSAFLKIDENFVISSSPELFLEIEKNKILSRPIKGTAPRGSSKKSDLQNKNALKNSTKERAENLMIVDLVRNDLARICKAGSVKTNNLFHINSYAQIHHMSSEVSGKLDKNFTAFDALRACFPPGSMTGAPKIKAMEIAAKKEKIDRGIYSGAIGFFSRNEMKLSVVIRTLILNQKNFEFQVGGAITFDSNSKNELAEIYSKARGISKLLGLKNFS